jgi:ADP-heptose:LPS heptosyltransferase
MKILFITSGSIGDAIISTGIITYLMDAYPQATFTIAAGAASIPLFEGFPKLDRAIAIRKKSWKRHWLTLWQEVRKEQWDLVVDLRGSALGFLISAEKRIIFHDTDKRLSKAEQLATMLKLDRLPLPRLWSTAQAKQNAEKLLPTGKDIVIIAPKTNSAAKDWPIERFAELAKRIYRDNFLFVVLASKAQKESVQSLVSAIPGGHVLDLSGVTDLLTAYAIMERATLFIGNDSGLLHMAAASGIHCIGIYGPSNDKIYAPRGPHVHIVKSYEFEPGEEEKRDNKYMQMISVDMVEEVLLQSFMTPAKKMA